MIDSIDDARLPHELIELAYRRLEPEIWDYLIGGSETETTLVRNRAALDKLALRPRVLRNVSSIDTSSNFLDWHSSLPIALAPIGSLDSFWENGALEAARAASEFGVPIIISAAIPQSVELAAINGGSKVLQLFARGDEAWFDEQIKRATELGYSSICITVDQAMPGSRERDIAKRFEKPWSKLAKGAEFQAKFDWDDLARLLERSTAKIWIKGIATAEDAVRACDIGVEAIYISNHGGRQLDYGRGSATVAAEIIPAVDGRTKIVVDGGVCRGSDVVKLIAQGADCVGIGRLYLYGLAAGGAAGVRKVLEILQHEVQICLGLLGVTSFAELDPTYLEASDARAGSGAHSAFPLLRI